MIPRLRLAGHLTSESLAASLRDFETPRDARTLLVDVRTMTGYEASARADFVAWVRGQRRTVVAIAILTDNPLWHMVIVAMSLASGITMKPFSRLELAVAWLERA